MGIIYIFRISRIFMVSHSVDSNSRIGIEKAPNSTLLLGQVRVLILYEIPRFPHTSFLLSRTETFEILVLFQDFTTKFSKFPISIRSVSNTFLPS